MRFKQKRLLAVIVRADCTVDVAESVGRYVCIFAQKLCGFLACRFFIARNSALCAKLGESF